MAVTKIIPIRTTIQNSINYICNPSKTDDRLLVHSEHCFPNTAGLEFQHFLNQTRAGGNTIGRHLIQSFAPNEATPEQAHEIGKRLANEILKGEYAFVMATHVDRGHIHNHFVFCAANIITHKKYRSNKNTYHEIRNVSDRLCNENNLSVIVPQGIGKSYDAYRPDQRSESWRDKLKIAIDNLIPEVKDFEELLKRMEAQGYKVKRGKYISFSADGQGRFTRAKSLGIGYTEDEIKRRIFEKPEPKAEVKTVAVIEPPPIPKAVQGGHETRPPIKPLIDIAGNPKFAERRGLEQWAKLQNLKSTAPAFNLMQEYGGIEKFNDLYADCRTDVKTIENGINANLQRVVGLKSMRDTLSDYYRTKPIYKEYKETKLFKNSFYKKHEDEITEHERAATVIKSYERPLPKIKDISAEISKIETANVKNNKALSTKKSELKQLGYIHTYLHQIRREHEPPPIQQQAERQPTQRKRNNDYSL